MPKPRLENQLRKRRVRLSKAAPFPVPIQAISGGDASCTNWMYYRGTLAHNGVVVTHTGDMDLLYRMGFFGKGDLSRGQPDWSSHSRLIAVQPQYQNSHQSLRAKLISRRRYLTHLQWNLIARGEALEKIMEEQETVLEKLAPYTENSDENEATVIDKSVLATSFVSVAKEQGSDEEVCNKESAVDTCLQSWGSCEAGDSEFWASDSTAQSVLVDKLPSTAESVSDKLPFVGDLDCEKIDQLDRGDAGQLEIGQLDCEETAVPSLINPSFLTDSDVEIVSVKNDLACVDKEMTVEQSGLDTKEGESEFKKEKLVEWSELSKDDDDVCSECNMLFVVMDSDDEECTDGEVCRLKKKWRPVLKVDPFPVRERLQISYEEIHNYRTMIQKRVDDHLIKWAFFLSYGLGCLTVLDDHQTALSVEKMWQEFCHCQPTFLPKYIAYHYYRSKNWVPKTGLKFGCTFLLYKDGPPFYHGSYSVVVRFVDSEGRHVEGYGEQQQLSWTSLAGLKRITEHVAKELIMCYVIKPKWLKPEDMLMPSCIPLFQVKEMLLSRWVSSQEREGKALEDMP